MLNEFDVQPDKDKTDWEKLSDNRDVQVFRVLGLKTEKLLEDRKSATFEAEKLWLRMRNLIIRCVTCAHRAFKQSNKPSDESNGVTNGVADEPPLLDLLSTLIEELRALLKTIDSAFHSQSLLNVS